MAVAEEWLVSRFFCLSGGAFLIPLFDKYVFRSRGGTDCDYNATNYVVSEIYSTYESRSYLGARRWMQISFGVAV